MLAPDDMQVGDWIVLTDSGQFAPPCNGMPLQIRAVSLPYIATMDTRGRLGTVDVRFTEFQLAEQQYVNLFIAADDGPNGQLFVPATTEAAPAAKEPPDPRACPRCGDRMVQLWQGNARWIWHCRRCGHDGELAAIGKPV